ncbi:alternative tryptophan synthase beta-subunit [Microbacterium sp. Leaf436]|uniref:alternative tryptophan synthase beta-subunit n=1 Tax=Microbacterium sp. Leaf436 TaxID=1736377 RepID=UPI001F1A66DC|nr:alternative tryptophan synthase beta-subunit [Microbacterium sp. Leaf436]
MPGGWEKLARHRLTIDYARELRTAGFTLMRIRSGWGSSRERSIGTYLQRHEVPAT